VDISNTWSPDAQAVPEGDEHARLVDELRRLQDSVAEANAPVDVLGKAADLLAQARDLLDPHATDEEHQLTAMRWELLGRGQTLVPVQHVDELTATTVRGRVTFGRFHLGRGAAVHGGSIPLLWDEVLGGLVQLDGVLKRTAFLHVDYRALTPLDREITFTAQVDRVDGRKCFASGRLMDGEVLCAEVHGLFVADRPSGLAG
jgi:acyl-coenzyme A thioesterase PaaI-like protein